MLQLIAHVCEHKIHEYPFQRKDRNKSVKKQVFIG